MNSKKSIHTTKTFQCLYNISWKDYHDAMKKEYMKGSVHEKHVLK